MKITLPAVLNPISRRKDKSVKISLETRELSPEETLTLMAMEGSEGWFCLAPNQDDIEIPKDRAEVEGKTPSERLMAVLYVWYMQETNEGNFVGLFQSFRDEKMESIIRGVKSKIK